MGIFETAFLGTLGVLAAVSLGIAIVAVGIFVVDMLREIVR